MSEMLSGERRLAAIMFTDIVGYTRSAQSDESQALALLEEHRSILRPVFASHGGAEVKTMGDAFLVEFKSALDAVRCAAEIQERIARRNAASSRKASLLVRVGIHVGDVVHGSGDVYGDAVNVASRIEPLAKGGGICISEQVYQSVRNKAGFEFEPLGEVELKNVELPMGVYRLVMPGQRTPAAESVAPRARLAVLPFVNISPDPNDGYFADGLTEELITKLSQVGDLKVIARTSAMSYKNKEKKVSEIGRELNVGSVIEGSVRKAGNTIRVTVQLIDARTEEHLWASNYDKDLDNVFAIQSDIASMVAASVSAGSYLKASRKDTDDIESYTLYIKAAQQYHESTESSLRQAMALLDEALSKDPNFIRAHALLAQALCRLATSGFEEYSVASVRAEPAARRALELDPDSAEAHAALADIDWVLDRFDDCVLEAETAIRINPNLADAYYPLSVIHGTMGRFDEAIATGRKAFELDPLNENIGLHLATMLNAGGKRAEMLPILEKLNRINPRSPRVHNKFAEYYMFANDFVKAQEWLRSGMSLNPKDPLLRLNQGLLYAFTDRRREAELALQDLQTDKSEAVRLYGQLFIRTVLGDLDDALEALYKSADLHSWPALILTAPIFSELRKDSRFPEFCRKVGLPS
jgi:adenylate cyclase